MGTFLINALVFFGAMVIGSFGFCNIIGCIKFSAGGAFVTILIWLAILGGIAALAHLFLKDYLIAFYIAYGLSFLFSFKVKQD